jgi:hypothetical protein
MEIGEDASAVDGFPHMAASFFVLQAGGRRQPEDPKAARRPHGVKHIHKFRLSIVNLFGRKGAYIMPAHGPQPGFSHYPGRLSHAKNTRLKK